MADSTTSTTSTAPKPPDHLIEALTFYKGSSSYFGDLSTCYSNGTSPSSFGAYMNKVTSVYNAAEADNSSFGKSSYRTGSISYVANTISGMNREFTARQFRKTDYISAAISEHFDESDFHKVSGIKYSAMMMGSSTLQQK